jgi:hypothetical protein
MLPQGIRLLDSFERRGYEIFMNRWVVARRSGPTIRACGSSTSKSTDEDDGSAGSAGEGNGGKCEPGEWTGRRWL